MNPAVKDFDAVTIKNCNISRAKLRKLIVVNAPVLVLKETVTPADAHTVILSDRFFDVTVLTDAASLATLNGVQSRTRETKLAASFVHILHCG